jgi:hypothetical protein
LNLEPGQTRRVPVKTVCLDAGRPAPSGNVFDAVRDPLPLVRAKVLRWWADHPAAPQSAVNAAIWQNRDRVRVPPVNTGPKGLRVALHGGTVFRLEDGELFSIDPDGVRRFLGTGIVDVYPGEYGVYALVDVGEREMELWHHNATGPRRWHRVVRIPLPILVYDVVPSNGYLLLLTPDGVMATTRGHVVSFDRWEQPELTDLSVWPLAEGRALVVGRQVGDPGYYQGGEKKGESADTVVLKTLFLDERIARTVKRFWNVKGAVTGPAGTYALTHSGSLRRLTSSGFKSFGSKGTFLRILAVGRKHLWCVAGENSLALVHGGTGRTIRTHEIAPPKREAFAVDRLTDDLAVVRGKEVFRVRAEDGKTEQIE